MRKVFAVGKADFTVGGVAEDLKALRIRQPRAVLVQNIHINVACRRRREIQMQRTSVKHKRLCHDIPLLHIRFQTGIAVPSDRILPQNRRIGGVNILVDVCLAECRRDRVRKGWLR